MIGRGERSALKILKSFWPDPIWDIQVPLSKLCRFYNYPEKLSERQQKETIDIIIRTSPAKNQYLAVRVQDSRHRGEGLARADRHQKDILEFIKFMVIDLHEDECPELFKERVNYLSYLEIAQQLKFHKVKV